MICRSLDYYMLVMCFVVTIPQRCTTELPPPPFNLSYEWIDPFHIRLSWQVHPRNPNCSLKYILHGPHKKLLIPHGVKEYKLLVTDLNSNVTLTLKTTASTRSSRCPYEGSNPVSIVVPRQVQLVTDFKFLLYPPCDGGSSQTPLCGQQATWTPGNGTSGLSVSYRLCDRASAELSLCQDNSSGLQQGCHLTGLQNERKERVCILFRGTVEGRALNQTFERHPHNHIRTFPPNVSVSEQEGRLKISWQHAKACPNSWKYTVNYSECDRPAKAVPSGLAMDHLLVPFNEACRYEIRVQPQLEASCGFAQAERSVLLVYNDGATPDHSVMVGCVAVPSLLSVLVVALCYYVRRKRNTFFKKIPVPPSSLKEMMSSLQQSQQLFVPEREKVDVCSVSPVSPDPLELHTLIWGVP